MTRGDVQFPLTARPDFAESVVMYKAASLEAAWKLVEADPFYKKGVVRVMLFCVRPLDEHRLSSVG